MHQAHLVHAGTDYGCKLMFHLPERHLIKNQNPERLECAILNCWNLSFKAANRELQMIP